MSIKFADARKAITDAISIRSNPYEAKHAIIVSWAKDDTQAESDVISISQSLHRIGVNDQTKLSLGGATPGWDLLDAVRLIERTFRHITGPVLLFFFYAGHGAIDSNQRLRLCESTTSTSGFAYDSIAREFAGPGSEFDGFANTDVIVLLDCCYAGKATRSSPAIDRTVEVIAAAAADGTAFGNFGTFQADSRRTANNLTWKFAMAVDEAWRNGWNGMEMDWLIEHMKKNSSVKMPHHGRVLGTVPIRVPIEYGSASVASGSSPVVPSPATGSSGPQMLFTLKFPEDEEASAGQSMLKFIRRFDKSVRLDLQGVWRSNSTIVLLAAPWNVFVAMNAYADSDITLLGPVLSANLLAEPQKPKSAESGKAQG
ncbi:MAG: hypothetical protein M1837_000477 [Sclerophora amabilis]|nr:MAG: hypothetical protein M1837_000477 [Sclerophora amabilis]